MITKCKARFVIGYDKELKDHVIFTDGEVAFSDDKIIYVGKCFEGNADKTIDYGNAIISPGFVDLNALADIDTSVLELDSNAATSASLGKHWSERYWDKGPHDLVSFEENIKKARYALVGLLRRGITTALPVTGLQYRAWAETYDEFAEIAKVAEKLGIRTYLGPSYRSGVLCVSPDGNIAPRWDEEKGMKGLDDAVRFVKDFENTGSDLIKTLLIPSTIDTCSKELMEETAKYANEFKVPVRLHATQSAREMRIIEEKFGCSQVELLEETGLLNERFLLPHATNMLHEETDIKKVVKAGATVLHCPLVMANHGTALKSFKKLQDAGVRIALATDSYPSDTFRNMYVALITCRLVEKDPDSLRTRDVFKAATVNGADALGREDLGRLCEGAKADISVIDLNGFHIGQVADPIATMILNGSGADVRDVFVDGKHIMKDREIDGVDFEELHAWSQGYLKTLRDSYRERDYLERDPKELFGESFKTI